MRRDDMKSAQSHNGPEHVPSDTATSGAAPSAGWRGIGFILEYDDMEPGDVGFIINVPGGVVDINALRTAAAAPDLLKALKEARTAMARVCRSFAEGHEPVELVNAFHQASAAITKAGGQP